MHNRNIGTFIAAAKDNINTMQQASTWNIEIVVWRATAVQHNVQERCHARSENQPKTATAASAKKWRTYLLFCSFFLNTLNLMLTYCWHISTEILYIKLNKMDENYRYIGIKMSIRMSMDAREVAKRQCRHARGIWIWNARTVQEFRYGSGN